MNFVKSVGKLIHIDHSPMRDSWQIFVLLNGTYWRIDNEWHSLEKAEKRANKLYQDLAWLIEEVIGKENQ